MDMITPPDTAFSRKEAVSTNSMIQRPTDQRESSMVKCTDCGKEMPVSPIIKVDQIRLAVGERNKVKLKGEAITSDEFIELWKQLRQKRNRKRRERTRKEREKGERNQKVCEDPVQTEGVDEYIFQCNVRTGL